MNQYYRMTGVLGGMGPEATALFVRRLIEVTDARRDQEHLPLLILSDPRIPDRTAHILGDGESPLEYLIERARRLEGMGAELIAIPCNTAHYYWSEIQDSVGIPLLHIVRETVSEICAAATIGSSDAIGILATRGTVAAGIYHAELKNRGLCPLQPDQKVQDQIHQSIEWLKSRRNRSQSILYLQDAIDCFHERGASAVILGCTEIGLVVDKLESNLEVFDSLSALARATIREARVAFKITGNGRSLPAGDTGSLLAIRANDFD